uniref:Choline transporter-like protein n=1 Tax=Panagrolaimus superbus TaxID=310955 RepID=A0A914XUH1_9BILA
MHLRKGGGANIQPTAPSLSEYYYIQHHHRSSPSTISTSSGSGNSYSIYSEIEINNNNIPPPPTIALPELPPPDYPPREAAIALIGDRAANFDIPLAKLKKYQFKPKKSYNPLILTRRGCTDIFCCFVLIIFLAAWIAVAIFGFMWGKPERLIHPTDTYGRTCGSNRIGGDKPYLLFFDLTKCVNFVTVLSGCPTRQICVKSCPSTYYTYLQLQTASSSDLLSAIENKVICDETIDKTTIKTFSQLKNYVDTGWCTAYTVKSAAVLGRCMPEVFIDLGNTIESLGKENGTLDSIISKVGNSNGLIPSDSVLRNSTDVLNGVVNSRAVLQKIAADLSVSWWQILFLFLVAAIISFLWTVIMRLLGGLMIWFSLFLLLGLLAGGAGYCWFRYVQLYNAGAINDYSFQPVFSLYFEMPTTWMILGIILSILLIVMFIIFLFVMSRIRLAVAVIEETSRALGNMLSTLFFPFIPFILHIIVFIIWGSIAIWLASSGEENCRYSTSTNPNDLANGPKCDCDLLGTAQGVNCRYVNYTRDTSHVTYMQLYNLFACFWMSCFVGAFSDITLAGAFASYYWAFTKPKDIPSFPVLSSAGRALRYHMGSLAFGSLILAIVKFIRAILEFLYQKLHASQNKVLQIIFTILKCFFFCLEHILRILTTNAYIMIAMYGKGFFRSAKDSFSLITRNIIRTVVLNRVVAFLLFVGKATITIGMGLYTLT